MTTSLSRTDSALKAAEEGFQRGPSPGNNAPGAIISAMEIAQPGSSAKLLADKEKKSKKSKKKSKKGKKTEKEPEAQKGGETEAPETGETAEVEQPDPKMEVMVKHLERRLDEKDEWYITEPLPEPPKETGDKWANYILCEIRHFNWERRVFKKSLQVNSRHLKAVLKKVIGWYPGMSFRTQDITLIFPLNSLYHYLEELKAELEVMKKKEDTNGETNETAEDSKEAIIHLEYLINYVEIEFQDLIKTTANLLPQGLISYDILWAIFKPGCIIYTRVPNNQQRCLEFERGEYETGDDPCYCLSSEYASYNGTYFGSAGFIVRIRPFEGTTSISSLAAFPLKYHPMEAATRESLIARGRLFETFTGSRYMEYKGIALGEKVMCGRVQYSINSRVMCDKATYDRINPDRVVRITPFPGQVSKSETSEGCSAPTNKKLTDEQCLLTNFLISGFAFGEKKWVDFNIDQLSPIQWNENAFEQLVLPASQKSLVRVLVESHVRNLDGFDDIIKSKGKGLISILHGPPGVGKTLTAESVAEYAHRPLYTVSSGELGIHPQDLESNLSRILDVAAKWKAVLLLDEADVFLEKRSHHDLTRNSLVSIFLRLLEYYQGILFLTSNRVTSFDEAFQSRIHVALKYNQLDRGARMQVWKNFMDFDGLEGEKEQLETVFDRVLNGRQIKNCVKIARSLAESEGKKVDLSHLMVVLDIQQRFEDDFGQPPPPATNGVSNGKL